MNIFIKNLKIGLVTILITILGFWQSLNAFERDWSREGIRKNNIIENKIITPEFREFRRNILLKVENWEITQDQARITLREERLKLEDKTVNDNEINTNQGFIKPKKKVYLKDNWEFQKRKQTATTKLKAENLEKRKAKQKERKAEIDKLKREFENYRSEIFLKVKNWEITIDEAKSQLDTYRQNTIVKQRDKYKQERELEKKQHKQRVDSMIESKVKEKFSKYDTLSKQEQLNKYEKILEKISQLDNNTDINNKQKTVLNMIKVVIEAKKNSLG